MTRQRFTGFTDKYWQPIYEGSIVRRKTYTGIVFFEDFDGGNYYVNRAGKRYDEHHQMLSSFRLSQKNAREWRVIGHIHEQRVKPRRGRPPRSAPVLPESKHDGDKL